MAEQGYGSELWSGVPEEDKAWAINALAALLAISANQVQIPLNLLETGSGYYSFQIPKTSGKMRDITAPFEPLKALQRAILDDVLCTFSIHRAAFGFVPNRDFVDGAKMHLGLKSLFNLDLKDAFPSVHPRRVEHAFSFGLREPVKTHFGAFDFEGEKFKALVALCTHLCCLGNSIPQGTPTSPCLLNIVCVALDQQLASFAVEHGLTYTRYADDISLSSKKGEIPRHVRDKVFRIIREADWKVNHKKTIYIPRRGAENRFEVTGVAIFDNGTIGLPKRKKEEYLEYLSSLLKTPQPTKAEIERARSIFQYVARLYKGRRPQRDISRVWEQVRERHNIPRTNPHRRKPRKASAYTPPEARPGFDPAEAP